MKKSLAFLLSLALVCSLAACGTPQTAASTPPSVPAASAAPAAEPSGRFGEGKKIMMALNALGDLSFNDLLYDGVMRLEEKYGFEVSYAEVGTDISTYEGYFFDFCDKGYDFIFLRSGFLDICKKYAQDYPEIKFIVYDTTSLDECEADNVYLYASSTYQAAYLVGMAAAGTSQSGVIGFVGGQENPLIYDFLVGYIQGAKAQNPDIVVTHAFVGSYNDTAKGLELANAQINSNKADIVFAVCGSASLGVFQACRDNGVLAIGCDSDQYQIYNTKGEAELASVIITSCLKKIDESVVQIMDWVAEGQDIFSASKAASLGLAEGVVGVADNENYQKFVSADLRAAVAEAQAGIVDGSVKVTSAYHMSQAEIDALIATASAK